MSGQVPSGLSVSLERKPSNPVEWKGDGEQAQSGGSLGGRSGGKLVVRV